jgi:predicted DCC family thiol-disulfide oxidoreductase YuxK
MTDTADREPRGYVLYDGECRLCIGMAQRYERTLARRGFQMVPLQTPWVAERLGLADGEIPNEMRVLLSDNAMLGGADAVVYLAGRIWWAWPLWLFGQIPGARWLLRAGYRWIAARRHCFGGACELKR